MYARLLGPAFAVALGVAPLSAVAADLSPQGMRLAPAPAYRAFSWTGCHLGIHLGGGLVSTALTGQFVDPTIPSTFGAPTSIVISNGLAGSDGAGVIGGGQIGCDLQAGPRFVIGFDVDASGSTLSGGPTESFTTGLVGPVIPAPTTVVTTGTFSGGVNYIATTTGRLGYAYDTSGRGLFYVKGGAAWAGDSYSYKGSDATTSCAIFSAGACSLTNPVMTRSFSFGASDSRIGWTAGFGWEWAVATNWSVKFEYDYIAFASHNLTFSDAALGSASIGIGQHINELKAGVNYLVGG